MGNLRVSGIHFLLSYSCTRRRALSPASNCAKCSRSSSAWGRSRPCTSRAERPSCTIHCCWKGSGWLPLGLRAGIVTNACWATSVEDAEIWLQPIRDIGIADLSVTDDAFHQSTGEGSPARLALAAAVNLGIPCDTICILSPATVPCQTESPGKGQPVIGGGVLFKGRAAEKLTVGLPRRRREELTTCLSEAKT